MVILAKIISIIIVVAGIVFAIAPDAVRKFLAFAKKDKNVYIGGIVRVLFGIILLFAAASCKIPWFVTLFGIILLSTGLLIFALSIEKLHALLDWVGTKPDIFLRIGAGFAIVVGALLLYCI